MNRELIIEHTPDLVRAALLEEGKLCEIYHEKAYQKKVTDSLYLGRIQAIRPSLGAAFVDIGEELNAFMPLKDGVSYRCGQEIIVQGSAIQSVDTKGLRITDTVNLAGKWLVLIPGAQGVRLSKKIKEPSLREALLHVVEPLCPDGFGIIVRTASADFTEEQLGDEIHELLMLWESIALQAKGRQRPGILHEPPDLVMRLIRDLGNTLQSVVTNSDAVAERLYQAKQTGWLPQDAGIRLFEETSCLLSDVYAIDSQVDKALKKRVWLPCGGYLIFDICEALTVIDVNSGKMTLGRELENTALLVNLEAAKEIARQLRLRDIGGIVIVDYIDMKHEESRNALLQEIRRVSALDRSQLVLGGMTKFGLVEMTRKRKSEQLHKALQTSCKVCGGHGAFLSGEETARRALRQVMRMLLSGQRGPFLIRCAAGVFSALTEMTAPQNADLYALGENSRHAERFEIEQLDIGAVLPKGALQLKKRMIP